MPSKSLLTVCGRYILSDKFEKIIFRTNCFPLESKMRRVKDIECEKCGHEFSASEHTQCPKCIKLEEKNKNYEDRTFNSKHELILGKPY